jgi:hypothetical protein
MAKVINIAQRYANEMKEVVYVYKKEIGYDFTTDISTAQIYTVLETVYPQGY